MVYIEGEADRCQRLRRSYRRSFRSVHRARPLSGPSTRWSGPRNNARDAPAMRPPLLNPLFASLSTLPGIGPKLEKLFARLLGARGRAAAHCRSAVPSADRLRRPPQPAETERGGARHGGDGRGHGRAPSPAAAQPPARALQHRYRRRHQHADHHLFQRAPGLSGKALARGRAALRVGHRHALRRPSADGASRPRGR